MKNFFKKLFCSDSMSKHFSETVKRVGKNNAGFSLVELIVVIAIMAILAAVAVIGVSVYIPYSQKAADEQMIADVQKAIDLYATGESLTPGQSGYVVIHKNGGGENGNVTTGGAMDQLITDALLATYGDKYGTELKVAYQKWTGTWSTEDVEAIQNSIYMQNVYGKDDGILETVQMLTDAMKGFYDGKGSQNSQEAANQAVLDVAAGTKGVNKEKFVAWWTDGRLDSDVPEDAFDFSGQTDMGKLKIMLAASYAKAKAFVMSTGCADCNTAFVGTNGGYFEGVSDSSSARAALAEIKTALTNHLNACPDCLDHLNNVYFSSNGSAKSDAEAYIALLGKIDSMSDTITESPEFKGDNLYTSGFVKDFVNEYVSEVEAYENANAQPGDIVITVLVDQYGNLRYKGNLTE